MLYNFTHLLIHRVIHNLPIPFETNSETGSDFVSEQFYIPINNRVPISFFTFAENTVGAETQQPEEKTKV